MSLAAKTLYEFTVNDVHGKPVSLDKYRGKVVIVVNVASACGLTNANYQQLKELQAKYYGKGFRVAAFPCNQFGGQEPDCAVDVAKFVKEKFGYEPDLYDKIEVNGDKVSPLFNWLKKANKENDDAITWNFTKFLMNRKGKVFRRYEPKTEPVSFIKDIEKLIAEEA